MLTRDQIQAADDVKTEDVSVPEWGGDVRVRTMTVADRLRMRDMKTDGVDGRVLWIIASCVAEDGSSLFEWADAEWLMNKSRAAIDRIYPVIERLNGLGAAAVERAEKN